MRLIDADALIEDIKNCLWDWDSVDGIKASTVLKQTITDINNAPTIEPTDTDLISRADAIEAVQNLMANEDEWYQEAFSKALKALPSADAEWIPCSERLPEDGQGVLVTVDANKWNIEVGSCIYSGGTFHSKLYDLDVIAWMPLPEPYKGGDYE